jgi:hypothetical protein
MKFNAILLAAVAGLASTALANPYAEALFDRYASNVAKRDQLRLALDARDAYEHDLYSRAIATSNIYARNHPDDFLLSPRDLEERELVVRSTIVWSDPSLLNQKGKSAKAEQGRTLKAQYEHFIRDWAETKFGKDVYVRIQ